MNELFQDMFPDYELVASVREELDIVVEEGVANIVQLLRNSESGVSSAAAKVVDEESFRSKDRKRTASKRWTHEDRASQETAAADSSAAEKLPSKFADLMPAESLKGRKFSARLDDSATAAANKRRSGKLSAQLMDSGLLTKDMMKQLKREWTERMQLEIEESEMENQKKKK